MKYFLAGLFIYIICIFILNSYIDALESPKTVDIEKYEQDPLTLMVWGEIQDWRVMHGYSEYAYSPDLCGYAWLRLEEIQDDWSHWGFWIISDSMMEHLELVASGENLARDWGQQSPVDAWLASPSHRENLERNYTVSCLVGKNGDYVQLFGK